MIAALVVAASLATAPFALKGSTGKPIRGAARVLKVDRLCRTPYVSSTNHAKTSQDLFSGEWLATNTGVSNPTLGNNTSSAPSCAQAWNLPGCGLDTADRIQAPAVTGAQSSFIYQTGCPNEVHSTGWWVAGTAGGVSETGTVDIYTGGGEPNGSFRCTFAVHPNWTWCTNSNAAAGTTLGIGNIGTLPPAGARPALDIQVWQADCQTADTITPSIGPTTTTLARGGCVNGAVRVLAGMGDSITLASGTGLHPLPVRVAYALDGTDDYSYGWIQGGVSGDTCAQVRARWDAVKAQGVTHMFLHCGVNDARTGRTAAQAWGDQLAILTDALASGIKVRLVKTLNFEGAADADPSKVTMINDLKVLQQAWCDAQGLACADPAATMQTGNALINHQGDLLHPDATGSELLKTAISVWAERTAEGWP